MRRASTRRPALVFFGPTSSAFVVVLDCEVPIR
jgi:hypothetical protein